MCSIDLITPLKLNLFKQKFASQAMVSPMIQLKYWIMGQQVVVAFDLLDNMGKTHFAFKHHFFQEILTTDFDEWQDKPMHHAFSSAVLLPKHAIEHGPNLPLLGYCDYPERYLVLSFLCNPAFENVDAQVEKLGLRIQDLLNHELFQSVYLAFVDQRFQSRKMYTLLANPVHDFWKHVKTAKVEKVKEEHMDSYFLDQDMISFIPVNYCNRPLPDWSGNAIKKLFKSGEFPDSFKKIYG